MANSVSNPNPYRYFDTPEGQDTFKKLWVVMKPTFGVAVGVTAFDVVALSQPKHFSQVLGRCAFVGLPVMGIAATHVLVTNTLANVRQKNDRVNWFAGGFASGSIFGLWSRKIMVGFNMGMLFAILSWSAKYAFERGWSISPENVKMRRGGATACLRDFSLTAERPANWTTGKEC